MVDAVADKVPVRLGVTAALFVPVNDPDPDPVCVAVPVTVLVFVAVPDRDPVSVCVPDIVEESV